MKTKKKLQRRPVALFIIIAVLLLTALPSTASAKKKITCLFFGNSVSYYNNMPLMYQNIVSAATGQEVEVSTIMGAAKFLHEFSFNVNAVVHSKGDYGRLNRNELFYTDRNSFDEALFNQYKEVLLNDDGTVKHYDYLFLPDHGTRHDYAYSKLGIMGLVKSLADRNTTVVISMPNYHLTPKKSLDKQKKHQDRDDRITKKVIKDVKKSGKKVKRVVGVFSGKAYLNYCYAYGFYYASRKSPKDYKVYKDLNKYLCDLLVKDGLHSTQLGSYLQAVSLYSAVYKKSAADTVDHYRAVSDARATVLHRQAKGTNYAMQNGPFRNKTVLRKICEIADQTQNNGLDLRSRAEGKKWRKKH